MAEYVSLKPTDAVEGGGAPIQLNLTVKTARFVVWDYDGKAPPSVATRLLLVDDHDHEYTQYYSAGSPERLTPTPDGHHLKSLKGQEGFNKSTNTFLLFKAIVDAGFPLNKLAADITVLEGLYAYWDALVVEKRAGLAGSKEGQVITVPTKILRLPWETGKAARGAAKQSSTPGSDTSTQALHLLEKMSVDGQGVERGDLAGAAFGMGVPIAQAQEISGYVLTAAFIKAAVEAGFTLDGETFSRSEKAPWV